jgi:predicted metal-dependent peptidase
VIFYDTSGSIGGDELAEFAGHANHILYDAKPDKLYVVPVDAAVHEQGIQELRMEDFPFMPKPFGGGGTDFRPAFEWIEKQQIEPDAVLYLTDMMGTFPDEAPSYPVLWVSNSNIQTAPFGKIVDIRIK